MASHNAPAPTRTPAQRQAVETVDKSLLVSAAAGSGKTSVLSWRCAYLVCDAPHTCNVTDLLVVTFTEAAAAEMKTRIEREVRKRIAETPSPRLNRQMKLVDHASISTLHGFCQRLLRQHYHRAALDPDFEIIGAEEAKLLRYEMAHELLESRFDSEDKRFLNFVDAYADRNTPALVSMIASAHELLCSLVDPEGWVGMARAAIHEGAAQPLEQSRFGSIYLQSLQADLDRLADECCAAIRIMPGGFDKYIAYLHELQAIVGGWRDTLAQQGYNALVAEAGEIKLARLPTYKNDTPNKESAQEIVKQVQERVKHTLLLRFTADEWRQTLRMVQPHADEFLDLVTAFGARYAAAKRARRGVDFSDLERFALQLLRDPGSDILAPSDIARSLHKRYRHVLVDEYQDINELQDAILHLASHECLMEAGLRDTSNLFCVGDVKQSIYRFRLAEPQRFLDREKHYRQQRGRLPVDVIDLQSNFRSRKPLLDAVNALFERLMTEQTADVDYSEHHRLNAGITYPTGNAQTFSGAPIEVLLVPDDAQLQSPEAETETTAVDESSDEELEVAEREAMVIARRIQQMILEGKKVTEPSAGSAVERPMEYRDIAILLRTPRFTADQYATILRKHGIPVHTDAGIGFFDATEIRDMFALLRVLDNQRQDIPLAAVLRSPMSGLPDRDDHLARIRLRYPDEDVTFHEAVTRYASECDDELAAHLRDLLERLQRWRQIAHQRPPAELIWQIYDDTALLAYSAGLRDGPQRVANLMKLHERAGQFGAFRRQGLWRFLQFVSALEQEQDIPLATLPAESSNVVRIMSVHKSKGLEYPVVFFSNLGRQHNRQESHGRILLDRHALLGISVVDETLQAIYPSLSHVVVKERIVRQSTAEAMRLLYVAMTRAKEHLILVGTCKSGALDNWQQRWSGHTGAIPTRSVLAGNTFLDWIVPAAIVAGESHYTVTIVDDSLLQPAPAPAAPRAGKVDRSQLVALKTLPVEPAANASADAVIQRLTWRYGYEDAAHRPATQSVTALSKGTAPPASPAETATVANTTEQNLPLPRVMMTDTTPSPTDRGTFTHAVLEHLDFNRPCTGDDLTAQIDALVQRSQLTTAQAAAVDRPDIEWMMHAPVGQLLQKHAGKLLRELPIYLSLAGGGDPRDDVMVRGRIDLVVPTEQGYIVVDYKTDRVRGQRLRDRAEGYRRQMSLYDQAIQRIAGVKPFDVWLVFLHGREIIRRSDDPQK